MPPDEFRMKLKKEGKLPPRTFQERPVNISNTGAKTAVVVLSLSLSPLSLSHSLSPVSYTHLTLPTTCGV